MSPRALLAVGLCLGSAGAWAAKADFIAVQVMGPTTVQNSGGSTDLAAGRAIAAGDVVSAGARGKVALQLAGSGLMTLSSLGDLQVFDARGAAGKQPPIAKLKLLAGALRVDTRAVNGRAAQDVRLNIGSLKSRVFNADAWGANTAEGDTLCVMAGAVSVQTDSGDERLDTPGSCLRREPDGQLSRFASADDPVIVGAIAATRLEGAGAMVNSIAAEAQAEASMEAQARVAAPVVAVAKAEPLPPPASPSVSSPSVSTPSASSGGDWTVVVLSLAKPEPVAAQAQVLVQQGLPATVRQATVNGQTMHRVAVGSFASAAEARAYAAGTLAKSGLKGWPAKL